MGWRKLPIAFASLSCFLFLVVFIGLIVSSHKGDFNGATILFQGNCSKAAQVNTAVRLGVTFVSFLVTLSSDRFLRLVLAPLPKEIQQAHSKAQWLEIGVNSWHNVQFVSTWRRAFWVLLLVSSIPLQLLFNSAVYFTFTSTDYQQIMVSQGFVDGGPWQIPGIATNYFGEGWISSNATYFAMVQQFQDNIINSNWTKMDPDECRNTYIDPPDGLQYYRDLVVVIEAGPDSNATGWTGAEVWNNHIPLYYTNISTSSYNPEAVNTLWMLEEACGGGACEDDLGYQIVGVGYGLTNNSVPWIWNWTDPNIESTNFSMEYNKVSGLYCLAEPYISPCRVRITNLFLFVVCICVFVKSLIATMTLFLTRNVEPIQCVGDWIQYLYQNGEDPHTLGLSTYDQDWFRQKQVRNTQVSQDMRRRWVGIPRGWWGRTKRWWKAVPRSIWWTTYLSIAAVLVVVIVIFVIGLDTNRGFKEAGFGDNPNNQAVHLFNGRVRSAVVANVAQSVLTACYFWFTAVFRRLFEANEWAKFASGPHLLRVTSPVKGEQNGTYFFDIPFFWGALFAICSVALHWSISQSLYVVATDVLASSNDDFLTNELGLKFGLAFSTGAITLTLALAAVTLSIPILLSLRTMPKNSIIVGTNSAAISAQCHRPRMHFSRRAEEAYDNFDDEQTAAAFLLQDIVPRENVPLYELRARNESSAMQSFSEQGYRGSSHEIMPVWINEETSYLPSYASKEPNDKSKLIQSSDDNIKDQKPWLQPLRWGVVVEGSPDPTRPGQLGLASESDFISEPVNGHFYQ